MYFKGLGKPAQKLKSPNLSSCFPGSHVREGAMHVNITGVSPASPKRRSAIVFGKLLPHQCMFCNEKHFSVTSLRK